MVNTARFKGFGFMWLLILLLTSCGGSSDRGTPASTWSATEYASPQSIASRFLTQATFGPTVADVALVQSAGSQAWLAEQFALPLSSSFLAYMDMRAAQFAEAAAAGNSAAPSVGPTQFYEHFYSQAVQAPDQLRQRIAFALSQIFVVSIWNDAIYAYKRTVPSYYDMLLADAFGNYRTLLEDVTLHPAMGLYLSTMNNQKENPATGLHPDENYAREVMQLFTIGLDQLNPDGSVQLDAMGNPVPTYAYADISGLAKVFTGWGWYAPVPTDLTFWDGVGEASETTAMSFYPEYHSISEKRFLGTTIPAASTPDPGGDLKIALDTLFNHPNVGPFLATRLIQQLVTSNPSPAYVSRVAAAFADNGAGVRGDLKAVIKAVLLDPEAAGPARVQNPYYGKLREPVLRLTNWMRAFSAASQSGYFLVPNLDSEASQLGESPMSAASVFNFWSPRFTPPDTVLSKAGLLAPEFQEAGEVSVAGYLNFMQATLTNGLGGGPGSFPPTSGGDVQATYPVEIPLANNPEALTDRMNEALCCGAMSEGLHDQIAAAVATVPLPAGPPTQADVLAALTDRVELAVFLTMASPEYLIQR